MHPSHSLLSASLCRFGAALAALAAVYVSFAATAWRILSEPFNLAGFTFETPPSIAGVGPLGVAADRYQLNRHEAHVSRRSAARNV